MTREEAIKTLKDRIEQYTGGVHPGEREILLEAFAVLQEQAHEWVRTADRLPTAEDCGDRINVVAASMTKDRTVVEIDTCYWWWIKQRPELATYWMPLPKLPEVEG